VALSSADFAYVQTLVRERAAIVLEDRQDYLVEARLSPVARDAGLASVGALVTRLRGSHSDGLHSRVVEAMTTNETSFFRDVHPFDALERHMLPGLIARRSAQRRLSIWSAACSSGQEPYTVAMILADRFPQLRDWDVRILATDISTQMLQRARTGRFSQLEMNRGLPAARLVRHFTRTGTQWEASVALRAAVEFRPLNLVEPWPPIGPVDVVLLRNVLIYFSPATKREILARVRRILRPDGFLILGGAETTLGLDERFERLQVGTASCYRLRAERTP
jgi:chemotaxis protein methyltransferase CheR